jgi:flagellar protein FliS
MLYDGALRFLGDARSAIERHDLAAKRTSMSRALAVLGELQSTLNMEQGGQIAQQLDALYSYVNGRMLEATMKNDVGALDECIKLVGTLRSGWAELAAREAAPNAPARP